MLFLSALALAAQLPELTSGPAPLYPPDALEEGRSGAVLLRLQIDAEGRVQAASVEDTEDPIFSTPALDAARAFRFSPARDDAGEAVPAEILWRVRFEPTAAPVVRLEGDIRVAGTRQPGAGFLLALEGPEERFATADEDGRFRFAGVEPGPWTLRLVEPGYEALTAPVTITADKVATVRLQPKEVRPWEVEEEADEVVVVYERPPAVEVSERALSTEQIAYLPGTGGDLVKAVQNLPGVARPAFGIGQLLIRGTAPEDSAYYLDGTRLPAVFHFAGLSTVLNGDILDEVALLSGNYSVRYGRTLGGIVDLRVDSALPERSSGYISVDLLQATAFVEQKIGKKTSLSVSGRRSYIDSVLSPVLSSGGGATVRAPRYYDLQARLLHHSDQGVIDAAFLLSDDAFRVIGEDGEDAIGLQDRFQKGRIRWTHDLGAGWKGEVGMIAGPQSRGFQIAPNGMALERTTAVNGRFELTRGYQGSWFSLRTGLDLYTGSFAWSYDVDSTGGLGRTEEKGSVWFTSPSPYFEPSVRFGAFELTGGLRVDPWILDQGYTALAVDPRFVGRIRPTPTTTFEAAVGQFSQFPGERQVIESQGGDPDLGAQRSLQSSVGLEQEIGPLAVDVTVFGSLLSNLVVGREDAFRFFSGPPPVGPLDTGAYANEGTGRIVGVEALVKLQSRRTLAWLSATYSRSTRTKREGSERELFEYDQPLVLTALLTYQLPKGWRLGSRVRFGSGNPYTPVANRSYDLTTRSWRPIYGEVDSARLPPFFAWDIRIDKEFTFKNWRFTGYLDVQNVTNQQNVDIISWSEDFSEEEPITGLPILPAFGFKGAW